MLRACPQDQVVGSVKRKSGFSSRNVVGFIVIVLVIVASGVAYHMISMQGGSPVRVLLVIGMGDITIELFGDMPITYGNFKNLADD